MTKIGMPNAENDARPPMTDAASVGGGLPGSWSDAPNAEKDAGRKLSDSQFDCLWALAIGSKGSGSNARTLESLRRRGLATVRQHQGEPLWGATNAGLTVVYSDPRSADA